MTSGYADHTYGAGGDVYLLSCLSDLVGAEMRARSLSRLLAEDKQHPDAIAAMGD